MKEGSSWLWICTLIPASNDVSSAEVKQSEEVSLKAVSACCGQLKDGAALTGLSPDWQVFILLDVQHELQAIAHSSLGGEKGRAVIGGCVERVTLPVAGEDLKDTREFFLSNTTTTGENSDVTHSFH